MSGRLIKGATVVAVGAVLTYGLASLGAAKLAQHVSFQRQGALVPKGDLPGQVNSPLALRTAPDGSVLVLSQDSGRYRLQRFDPRLTLLDRAPRALLQKAVADAVDMAVGADGTVLILRRGGKVSRLDPTFKAWSQWLAGRDALAMATDLEGGVYLLTADGSSVLEFDESGMKRGILPLSPVPGLTAYHIAVTPKGWVVALLLGTGPSTLQVLRPDGQIINYPIPALKFNLYNQLAALPRERIVLNRVHDLGIMTVDLNRCRIERICISSEQQDLFRSPGLVGADERSGLILLADGTGLVAGRLP